MHEQSTIARQQSAMVFLTNLDERVVLCVVVVEHIDPEEAQTPNEPSEMTVGDEMPDIAALQRLCYRRRKTEYLYARIALNLKSKIDLKPFNHDAVYFSVRYATRFDHVFDRGLFSQCL